MNFYLLNVFFILLNIFFYLLFRIGINSKFRLMHMSKTFVRKNKKGLINYWFYRKLYQQRPFGPIYYINILFLCSLLIYAVVSLLFGWLAHMRFWVILTALIMCVIEIPSHAMAIGYNNLESFGRVIVFFDREKVAGRRKPLVTILDWLFCPLPLIVYLRVVIHYVLSS